nr:PREDICTED: taste receptor type 2 member 135-like [Anolis carolinensis]|eukprot:XP_016852371.1 PREDICTED: taste receptor type 2 member 135-like [Anolis carolinensis]
MTSDNIVKVDILVWVIFGTVSLIGILGNGFIMVVNGLQWLQNRKIILCDFLLTSASTFRFIMQLVLLLYNILYYFPENIPCIYRINLMFFCWIFFQHDQPLVCNMAQCFLLCESRQLCQPPLPLAENKDQYACTQDLSTQVHIKVMTFLLLWLFFYLLDFIGLIVYTNIVLNTLKLNGIAC